MTTAGCAQPSDLDVLIVCQTPFLAAMPRRMVQFIATISGMRHTKTIVVIAHRLSAIEHWDRVFVLGDVERVRSGIYYDVALLNENA